MFKTKNGRRSAAALAAVLCPNANEHCTNQHQQAACRLHRTCSRPKHHLQRTPRTGLVGGESYHGCERHPGPIFVKPCVDETLPPRKWLPMFHTFCTEGAADDCRIAMQMHYYRFGQNL